MSGGSRWKENETGKSHENSYYHQTRNIYVVVCVAQRTVILSVSILCYEQKRVLSFLEKEVKEERTNGQELIDPFCNFRICRGSGTNQQVRQPLIHDCLNYSEGNCRDDLQIFNNV